MFQYQIHMLQSEINENGGGVPGFAEVSDNEAQENKQDESDILGDQDQTISHQMQDDENMGAKTKSLDSLEDEPADFMRGEVDVKDQMDRAADALDSSLHGYQNQAYEDSPRGELGASFRDTPGGLEEVIEKTDQYLATHPTKKHRSQKSPSRPPQTKH